MSYLRLGHLTEYFSNTVVYLPEHKQLCVLNDIEQGSCYDEETEEESESFILAGTRVSTNAQGYCSWSYEVDTETEGYDQLVPRVIKPYLPRTQYVNTNKGPGLMALRQPQHYKRSADNERYSILCPLNGDSRSRVTHPWDWSTVDVPSMEVVGAQLDEYSIGVLSSDFCIMKVRDDLELRWLGASVGRVNDNLGIEMHPLYRPHFEGLLAKTGATLC